MPRGGESWRPATMDRVAIVAPTERLREVLVAVADAGAVEIDELKPEFRSPATQVLERTLGRAQGRGGDKPSFSPRLLQEPPNLADLEAANRMEELAGEVEIDRVWAQAVTHDEVSALIGWCPRTQVDGLADRLGQAGGALARLPRPRGVTPPTLLAGTGASGTFQPLVNTYGTVPYRDLNPSILAGFAYVAMFGMMFGDVGHGLLLIAGGLMLRAGHPARLRRLRPAAWFLIAGGACSVAFGLAYGEAFGPTGLAPRLWLNPLDRPTTLLALAIAVGAGLLAISYGLGAVNRWRERSLGFAMTALPGMAGAAMYIGLAAIGLGWYAHLPVVEVLGGALAAGGLLLGFWGCYLDTAGRVTGVIQAGVEMFDATVRIGTNTVSFARLAAFGLTHAALGALIWKGTTALWHLGGAAWALAVLLLLMGNAAAFSLEGLVAAIQALRLEYYEMFSRIFVTEGRPFHPWKVPIVATEEAACSRG